MVVFCSFGLTERGSVLVNIGWAALVSGRLHGICVVIWLGMENDLVCTYMYWEKTPDAGTFQHLLAGERLFLSLMAVNPE